MACNICGFSHAAVDCPNTVRVFMPIPRVGWTCPACGKGIAPRALTCGHCAKRGPLNFVVACDNWKAGDMTRKDGF